MRIVGVGHAVFAATMIGLGIFEAITGAFPVPKGVPGREVLGYFLACVLVAAGLGLLWRRTAAPAARTLLAYFVLELVLRVPSLGHILDVDVYWALSENLVLLAASWVLYDWFATDWDKAHVGFAVGDKGLRIARTCYGLGLIPFGIAHFQFVDHTASMVPGWLPAHVAWVYFTGSAFIATGLGVLTGVYARLAATLSTVQIGALVLLVWVPAVVAGGLSPFQIGEVASNCVLLAAAWVVTDSYRGIPWLPNMSYA